MAGTASTADWRAQSGRLIGDLLTIEVDVVIDDALDRAAAPNLVGDGAEPTLREVVGMYQRWLTDHAAVRERPDDETGELAPGDLVSALRRIADDAAGADAALGEDPDDDAVRRRVVLRRIGGNAAQLIGALGRGPAGELDVARIARKAWELGTSEIVAQSVVQLDGDVIVRVDESILSGAAGPVDELNRRALGAALTHWRTLFDFVAQLVIGAAGLLTALWRNRRATGSALRRWLETRRGDARPPAATVRELFDGDARRRVVTAFRQLRDELLAGGGSTIESTTDEGAVYARTVVQPDGDVLWLVSPAALRDRSLLDTHAAAVLEWYERSGETVATLQGYLARVLTLARAVLAAIAVIVGAAIGLVGNPWAGLASLLAAGVLATVAAVVFRSVLGRLLRRGIGHAGGNG